MIDIDRCRLPRTVEDQHGDAVRTLLRAAQTRNAHALPELALDALVTAVLQRALRTGRLRRGLETALEVLENERRGLANLDRKTGSRQTKRVSRLILLSSDASMRLQREIERALERNAPRVLGLALQADSSRLGSLLFGPEAHAKVLLLDHKDTVADMLTAAAQQAKER